MSRYGADVDENLRNLKKAAKAAKANKTWPDGLDFDTVPLIRDKFYEIMVKPTGFAASYFEEHKAKETHRVLSGRPGFPAAPAILDFGCGFGNVDPYLRKYYPDSPICAVDVSGESVRIAKERNGAYNISYAVIDAHGGDFPFDIKFDLVLVCNVFHHVAREEQLQVFSRIRALLKPGGLLAVHEMNPYNPAIQFVFRKYDINVDPVANMLHPHHMRSQMAKAGFSASKPCYEIFFPGFLSALLPLEKHMTWLPFGARYYVIAENPAA